MLVIGMGVSACPGHIWCTQRSRPQRDIAALRYFASDTCAACCAFACRSPGGCLVGKEQPYLRVGKLAIVVMLTGCLLFFAFESRNWPWLHDAGHFHYVTFLIRHGMAPYRQIVDINMPGGYFSEFFGIFLFGPSDLGWRFYDGLLLLVGLAACISIASR